MNTFIFINSLSHTHCMHSVPLSSHLFHIFSLHTHFHSTPSRYTHKHTHSLTPEAHILLHIYPNSFYIYPPTSSACTHTFPVILNIYMSLILHSHLLTLHLPIPYAHIRTPMNANPVPINYIVSGLSTSLQGKFFICGEIFT